MSITLFSVAGGQGVTTLAAGLAAHIATGRRCVVEFDDVDEMQDFLACIGCGTYHELDEGEVFEVLDNLVVQFRRHRQTDGWYAHRDLQPVDLYVQRHPNGGDPSTFNVCVTRECYLALRRFTSKSMYLDTQAMIVHAEPDRALTSRDVEQSCGRPVIAVLHHEPAIARAVDAGLLAARLHPELSRVARAIVAAHDEHIGVNA